MKALEFLKESLKKIPVPKYVLTIIGIAAAIAVIKGFGIDDYSVPVITMLIIIGFMVLLMIFSSISKSKDTKLQLAGYILTYTTLVIACVSSFLLFTSAFFKVPINFDGEEKKITLTGIISVDGKIQREGCVGILQNFEIRDELTSIGTFNVSFISPERLNNGLVTLTLMLEHSVYELMEINLNDLHSEDNIIDLGTLDLPLLSEIKEDDNLEFSINSTVNSRDTIIDLNIKRLNSKDFIRQIASKRLDLKPIKSPRDHVSSESQDIASYSNLDKKEKQRGKQPLSSRRNNMTTDSGSRSQKKT